MIAALRRVLERIRGGPRDARHEAGLWGEDEAARLLRRKGYRILGRRVRLSRRDELDIVARHGNTLVFVEVKTRSGEEFGRPISSVDRGKRRALSRAAMRYLGKLHSKPPFFRFDVIEVVGSKGEGADLRHIENAFSTEPGYRIPW